MTNLTAVTATTTRGQAGKVLCTFCHRPGRKGDPLLHARKGGYAHDRCDRP